LAKHRAADVTFGEDDCPVSDQQAARALCVLRGATAKVLCGDHLTKKPAQGETQAGSAPPRVPIPPTRHESLS